MALLLKQVSPDRGLRWIRSAFALFARKPLAFTSLFVAFLFAALLASLIPVLGEVLLLMSLPLLSLGFMVASRSVQSGGAVHPVQFVQPLRVDRAHTRALLLLCALYGVATVGVLTLSEWIDGGAFERLQDLLAKGESAQPEIEALLADPRLTWGLVSRFGLASLLSVPFWHAPALVHWGGQGAWQGLFSSTLAIWRSKGAYAMYALAWSALVGLFGVAAALLFGLLGQRQMAGVLALPAGLFFSTVFYVSLIFTFDDCFGSAGAPADV
jgi:hypothetical protein